MGKHPLDWTRGGARAGTHDCVVATGEGRWGCEERPFPAPGPQNRALDLAIGSVWAYTAVHPDVGAGWLPRCGWGWHAGLWDLGHVCLALGPRRCAASRLERRERWQFTSMLLHIAAGRDAGPLPPARAGATFVFTCHS